MKNGYHKPTKAESNVYEVHYIRKTFGLPCNKNCLAYEECMENKMKPILEKYFEEHILPKDLRKNDN